MYNFKPETEKLYQKIVNEFFDYNKMMPHEYENNDFPAYLWPFSVFIEAASALYVADSDIKDEVGKMLRECFDVILPKYMDKVRGDYRVYNSTTDGGDPFYDDNAWIVLEFICAKNLFSVDEYLTLARETSEYCYSGGDDKLGGGIYWKEKDCRTKNTCICAPAAILSARLYRETGDKYYLDKAIGLYEFTKKYLLDSDGVYFDNVNADTAHVDRAKYTYNTGTMICAGAELFELTGKEEYLEDAKKSAEGGYKRFGEKIPGGYRLKSDHSWFNSWLLEGYLALEKHVDMKEYIDDFAYAVGFALEHKYSDGLVHKRWDMENTEIHERRRAELIMQSGTLKCAALLMKYYNQ